MAIKTVRGARQRASQIVHELARLERDVRRALDEGATREQTISLEIEAARLKHEQERWIGDVERLIAERSA